MNDMRSVIIPKSDQLNSDDLIGGPLTITITEVKIKPGEQPVSMFFDGDGGKPFKPCKSMARVMVQCWGADANAYVGRSMTIYRDPSVKWAGMAVGGIRISHMTDISEKIVMALTETKGSRKPFTVMPLVKKAGATPAETKKQLTSTEWLDELEAELIAAPDGPTVDAILGKPTIGRAKAKLTDAERARLDAMAQAAFDRTADPVDATDPTPLDHLLARIRAYTSEAEITRLQAKTDFRDAVKELSAPDVTTLNAATADAIKGFGQ